MNYYNPNPMQTRMDALLQQKQYLEQQINQLQQYSNVPPININNQITPQQQSNTQAFDFNGRWVDGKDQALNVANNNLPLILLDKNNPYLYLKNMDGSFKTFQLSEVIEEEHGNKVAEERMDKIENKLDSLIRALNSQNQPMQANIPTKQETADTKPKTAMRGGKGNE